jgi:hypothetical protein
MITGGLPRTSFDFTIEDQRVVTMDRVFLGHTYDGVLEGDPSLVKPDRWYEAAVDAALHHFHLRGRARLGRGVALVLPKLRESPPYPARPHVPYVQVFAFASSWHRGRGTALAIVWFQDSFDEPLLQRFQQAVTNIGSWDAVAIEWME